MLKMRYIYVLIMLSSCGVITDPKIYEDVVELTEEVVKDEVALTTAGSGTSILNNCIFKPGSSAALSIGTGTTVNVTNCTVNSSATNVFTGAGTCRSGGNVCQGSGSGNNVTTKVALTVI